jgi:hypothetical protein
MAIVIRIKAGVVVDEGEGPTLGLPLPSMGRVRGVVRLWYEQPSPPAAPGVPASRSDKWIVIGDDIGPTSGPTDQRYGEDIRSGDVSRVGGWQTLLTERGLSLDDYLDPTKSFSADLALPASIVDAYTG